MKETMLVSLSGLEVERIEGTHEELVIAWNTALKDYDVQGYTSTYENDEYCLLANLPSDKWLRLEIFPSE